MIARHHKRHLPLDTSRFAVLVLAMASLLALAFVAGWLARPPTVTIAVQSSVAAPRVAPVVSAPAVSAPAGSYLGVVQLAPDRQGRCEQFEIDNRTGAMRSRGFAAHCEDITATARPAAPRGALQSVGGYFGSH